MLYENPLRSLQQSINSSSIKTGHDDYEEHISWTTPSKGVQIFPPSNTLAIVVVVDLVDNRGAIRIYEKSDDKQVDMVGIEEAGNLVILPWDTKWWFRASGSPQVGYIAGKEK